ncbi:fasciclin domain-containing protein [Lacinutrix jangbogonensis]|uniref:fasciclin domain-containing protein n=1 Tax=Lacinutrix jangbogonensis TaxID=1469557 RepID=UPI00053E6CF0|nr:fasciclin domain-containing protein [Lacinutrix jangbogonensis]
MKNLRKLSILLLVVTLFWSCSNDDDNNVAVNTPVALNIVQTAQATGDLSSLVAAVIEADLATTLSGPGPFTVLAPTNAAFAEFLSANGWANVTEIPDAALTQVLLNHVISGTVDAATLTGLGAGYSNTLADGAGGNKMSIYFDTSSGVKFNGLASVSTADVSASNGIVHIVDKVITLPTLATFATTNPALADLVTALGSADSQMPSPMLVATLADATAGPLTVFTPTNAAFDALLLELDPTGGTGLGDIAPATVEAVLNIHIVGGNITSNDLTTGPVTTLGGTINVDTSNFTITDPLSRVTNIVTTLINIQAVNGVAHVVDKVIRP